MTTSPTGRKVRHRLIKRLFWWNTRVYFFFAFVWSLRRLAKYVWRGRNFLKTPTSSLDSYQTYDDRELRDDAAGEFECLVDGKIRILPAGKIRDLYLQPVTAEINSLLQQGGGPITILEVGCGNAINLVRLKRAFKDRIKLTGIDISRRRIEIGRQWFGDQVADIDLKVGSITTSEAVEALNRYDLVFSVHCLEQITYGLESAVRHMASLAVHRMVLVEPTWEFAIPAQRLYLLLADHAKTLLPTVLAAGLAVRTARAMPIQGSLKNQSSLIIIDKSPVEPE